VYGTDLKTKVTKKSCPNRVEDGIPDSFLFIDSFLANIGIRKNHTSQKDSFLFIDSAKKDGIVLGVPLDSKKSSILFCDWYITNTQHSYARRCFM